MARAISGHVTEKMTEHYSHIDPSEKRAVVQGMLSLVRGGAESKPGNDNRWPRGWHRPRQEGTKPAH